MKAVHNLNDEKISEYKEVFKLFDKDEDGVLSFHELNVVMKSLGQRPTGTFEILFNLNFHLMFSLQRKSYCEW